MEYAKDNIRVNAVAPGVVLTPMQKNTPEEVVMESRSPMGEAVNRQRDRRRGLYLTRKRPPLLETRSTLIARISAAGNSKDFFMVSTALLLGFPVRLEAIEIVGK